MGLYITGLPEDSKQDFTSTTAAGSTVATNVPLTDIGIFVGPAAPAVVGDVVTALKKCADAIKEDMGIASPGAAARGSVEVLAGASMSEATTDLTTTALDDTKVAVIVGGTAFAGNVNSSIFMNQVNRLIEHWMETVGKSL